MLRNLLLQRTVRIGRTKRSCSSERSASFKKHKGSQQRGGKWQRTRSKAFKQSLKKAKNEPFQLVSANRKKKGICSIFRQFQ